MKTGHLKSDQAKLTSSGSPSGKEEVSLLSKRDHSQRHTVHKERRGDLRLECGGWPCLSLASFLLAPSAPDELDWALATPQPAATAAPHRSPLHTSLEPPKPSTAFEVGFTDTRGLSAHCPASLREPISLKRESPRAAAPAPHKAAQRTPAVQVTGCPGRCVPSQAHTLPHAALTAPQLLPEKH